MNIHVEQLYESGYCIFPKFYDADACASMRTLMQEHWHASGQPSLENDFGFAIHPLNEKIPGLMPFLQQRELLETMSEAMCDEAQAVHLGGRISGPQSTSRLRWHHHYGWDTSTIPQRSRLERVLCNIYLDGSEAKIGAFVVLPRRYNDSLAAPPSDVSAAWPGEMHLEVSPGSVVIFDTTLWHGALRGSSADIRHIWGGHFQGRLDSRSHPEDNVSR